MSKKNQQMTANQILEQRKLQVQDAELKARYWKASFEIMDYSIKYEVMLPEYNLHLERMKEQEAERAKQFEEAMKTLQDNGAQVEENVLSEAEPDVKSE